MTYLDGTDRLDPQLRALATTRADFSLEAIQLSRRPFNERRRAAADLVDVRGVSITDAVAAGVPVRIYRGAPAAPAPAVVYCHAGGFALGNLDTDQRQCVELARRGRCTVLSVDYRLAPEHPYPAALDDAAAVLRWVAAEPTGVGVDPARLAVAGSSAGAALAACLAHASAGGSLPPLALALLHQPVLDDRPTGSKAEFRASPAFDAQAAELMWSHYLGRTAATAAAAPARHREFAGLPMALITCAEIDPFRDEAIGYAQQLWRAGVSTGLHVFSGTCHGFDSLLPDSPVAQRLFAVQGDALRRAFQNSMS